MGSRCRLLFKKLPILVIGKRALIAPFFLAKLALQKGPSVGLDGRILDCVRCAEWQKLLRLTWSYWDPSGVL